MAEIKLEEAPKKVRDIYGKAFAAFERGNLDYAVNLFMQVLELEPGLLMARKFIRAAEIKRCKDNNLSHAITSMKGLVVMIQLQSALKKNPAKALVAGEKLMRIDPLNPAFLKAFSQAAVAAGMPEVAIQTLEIAKDHHPQDTMLLNLLGNIYSGAGLTREARECFETVVRLHPNDQLAIKAMKNSAALDTLTTGRWETTTDYRDMLKDSDEAERLEQAGRAQKSESDFASLIQEQLQKIQREPGNVNFRRALADLYVKSEKFEEALETLEKANEMTGGADPKIESSISKINLNIYDYNIRVLREAGQEQEAQQTEKERAEYLVADAEQKVHKYPNDLGFKFDYGKLLFDNGDVNAAIGQFQRARNNPQRRTEALYYLGRCFFAKGQFDIAAEQISDALSEQPVMNDTKKNLYYELGQIFEAMGQPDKAMENYKEIYAVDIGYKDVAAKIDQGYPSKPAE